LIGKLNPRKLLKKRRLVEISGIKAQHIIEKEAELSISGSTLIELLEAVLSQEASFRFQAKGLSMSPFIKDGDMVTVSPLPPASP